LNEDAPCWVPCDRRNLLWLTALALGTRFLYLWSMTTPPFDPWRHLLLIQNIRAGVGFTLFDGQPYLWYSPLWYYVAAALPEWIGVQWLAGLLSALSVPAVYLLLRCPPLHAGCKIALVGGVLMAASGPVVTYTCHYGAEAPALFLAVVALLLCSATSRSPAALLAGLLFGAALVLRLNFALIALLFLPALRYPLRGAALAAGTAIPLLLTWWRNHRIISDYAYVFTWDGLATRTADFGPLSTLVCQMHPAVREGLRRLHELVVPWPEWIRGPGGISWGLLLLMVCSLACLLLCRRWHLLLTGLLALAYLLLLDRSMSSNFFRIYLPLLPVFFLAVALCAGRLWRLKSPTAPWLGWTLVGLVILAGAGMLLPPPPMPIEMVTPPPELLEGDFYMVNSSFYHPESLIYRYPGKRFIGMPLEAAEFPEFRRLYPEYEQILWHDFSVQEGLARYLRQESGYRVERQGPNAFGRLYVVLRDRGRD
jgi:hypothetical protein